jgi:hypothetical protein
VGGEKDGHDIIIAIVGMVIADHDGGAARLGIAVIGRNGIEDIEHIAPANGLGRDGIIGTGTDILSHWHSPLAVLSP